jgi:hypothetical protein
MLYVMQRLCNATLCNATPGDDVVCNATPCD